MAEGIDEAAGAFAEQIAPQSRPRDQGGKFVQVSERPEPVFSSRELEGDPETGDTSDGGDDPRFAEPARREPARRAPDPNQDVDDDGIPFGEEPENITAQDDSDDDDDRGEGPKYEITVDGERHEVTLEEALNGYIRQATFHQRQGQLQAVQNEIEAEYGRLQHNWALWDKAKQDYEEDLYNLTPQEPDWDREFAIDAQAAHRNQKTFQVIYAKLAQSRAARAEREAIQAAERDRRIQKYAVDGFARFVFDNKIPDKKTLDKELQSMRRTAAAVGFSEYEVATVYDPRMLTILRKASKYDRMMAARPRAVIPGKGKTLIPGAATPFGNARRTGSDDAQRQLAKTGKVSDAAEVFRRTIL
jgi:hypothetical protein